VASSAGFPTTGSFNVSLGGAAGGFEIVTVLSVSGVTWSVMRGAQGTTPLAAAVGATIICGVSAGAWTQVPLAWIERTHIGTQEQIVPFPLPHPVFTNVCFDPNPGEIPVTVTVDGWIEVPQDSDIALTNDMIVLNSVALAAFTALNETGVSASNPANPLAPTDLYFGLQMLVRQVGTTGPGTNAGTCSVIAVDNALYNNIDRHPEWAGGVLPPGQPAVVMLDIAELQSAGCAGITDSLTVLFTASHPNLGGVSIDMIGDAAGTLTFNLPTVPHTGNWYGTAINNFSLTGLEPCAYLVTLSASLLLTTGDTDFPNPIQDQFAFCLNPQEQTDAS
jgi:hypothetical protein